MDESTIDLSFFTDFKNKSLDLLKTDNRPEFNIELLAVYLESLLNEKTSVSQVLHLPSIEVLAKCFDCSYLDIHDAVRLLRDYGYEYEFTHADKAIRVWKFKDNDKKKG